MAFSTSIPGCSAMPYFSISIHDFMILELIRNPLTYNCDEMRLAGMRYIISKIRFFCVLIVMILLGTACTSPEVISNSPVIRPIPSKPALSVPRPTQNEPELKSIPFTIQVGAFSTTARAARYSVKLINKGVDAYYFVDEDGLYKVRLEQFEDMQMARQRGVELKGLGLINDFVVQPVLKERKINPRKSLRMNIVKTARRFIGTPYQWGGESKTQGFDCSGLTMTVYRLNGLALPRNSRSQFQTGTRIKRDNLDKGDLVFFATDGRRRVSHVGIYTGRNQFVHAPGRGKHIRISSMANKYYRRRFMGARRYF
jgi:hypothetical protein